ncbi:MAG TPA: MFS transporter [Pseudobacteroides sp.]|uniref:MFS transporter n=1 Tax=Pseudobacteroides sp. TaxID=1968840 RepID=UPI002F944A7B
MRIKYSNPFSALKHKNFRYYWLGMCISLIGTWMQNVAQPWLAYKLTESAFLLSLIGTLQFTPMLLFSLFAGVLIDRFSKRKILIFTQTASMVITLLLALLVWTETIQFWHILVMATLLGFVNTLDMPTRQSFVIELVGRDDLMNAVALNSSVFNIARIIGPALAGIVMGYAGISVCFFANALSFTAVVVSLMFIRPMETHKEPMKTHKIVSNIKDGLKYIYNSKILFNTILTMTVIGIFGMNFSVLVPVFAKEILKQQEAGFGFLMSFMGIGSFVGAMFVATTSKSDTKKLINFILYIMPLAVGVFLIVTGFMRNYILTGICLALSGLSFVSFSSTANSTMQLNSKDEYRGRVMSVYSLVFAGTTPLGNLYAGTITEHFGANAGFIACGAVIIVVLAPLIIYKSVRKTC